MLALGGPTCARQSRAAGWWRGTGAATRCTSGAAWSSRTTASCTRAAPYTGPATRASTRAGKLVSPGFINTHVHTAGNGGDYLLLDMAKNDYRTANYMAFAAPLKGKMTPPPRGRGGALRAFVFLHALKNGTTTSSTWAACAGTGTATRGWWTTSGVRVYGEPALPRPRHVHGRAGPAHLRGGRRGGRARLQGGGRLRRRVRQDRAGAAARALQRGPGGDLQRAACCGRARTRRARLDAPIHTHAGGNLVEFQRIMDEYRKTPGPASSPTSASSTSAPCWATRSSPPRTRGRTIRSATTCALLAEHGAAPSATARTSTRRWR